MASHLHWRVTRRLLRTRWARSFDLVVLFYYLFVICLDLMFSHMQGDVYT